ncbi:hypothetical protein J5690_08080 [bacterium]|nr:hypothetical protein [bacterium]
MKKVSLIIAVAALLGLAVSIGFNVAGNKKISSLEGEINKLKRGKIELLQEQEECLTFKEQALKKELLSKYLDSMMALLNKTEKGYQPSEKELADFYERADFILKNVNSIKISPEELNLVRTFIDSAKKTLEMHTKNSGK